MLWRCQAIVYLYPQFSYKDVKKVLFFLAISLPTITQTQGKLVKEAVIMSLMILLMTIRRMQKVSVFAVVLNCFRSFFFCQYYNSRNSYRLQFSLYFLLSSLLKFDFSLRSGHVGSIDAIAYLFPVNFLYSAWFRFDSLENYLCTPVCRGYHIITITNNYTTTHSRHRRC